MTVNSELETSGFHCSCAEENRVPSVQKGTEGLAQGKIRHYQTQQGTFNTVKERKEIKAGRRAVCKVCPSRGVTGIQPKYIALQSKEIFILIKAELLQGDWGNFCCNCYALCDDFNNLFSYPRSQTYLVLVTNEMFSLHLQSPHKGLQREKSQPWEQLEATQCSAMCETRTGHNRTKDDLFYLLTKALFLLWMYYWKPQTQPLSVNYSNSLFFLCQIKVVYNA